MAAEGKNKTETQYFKSIPSPDHVIRFAPGNYTDPVNMVYALRKEYEELELDAELGDAAFCLVDSDVDSAKDRQLEKADTEAGNRIRVVVSSPCFECGIFAILQLPQYHRHDAHQVPERA